MGQVRPLINLPSSLQEKILDEIILLRLSSRQVEDKVRSIHSSDPSSDETDCIITKTTLKIKQDQKLKYRVEGGSLKLF